MLKNAEKLDSTPETPNIIDALSSQEASHQTPTAAEASEKGVELAQSPNTASTVILRIRIGQLKVLISPEQGATIGQDAVDSILPVGSYLPVLTGSIEQFKHLDVDTSWLEVVAHNLFDPIQKRGCLWTHRDGTCDAWQSQPLDEQFWRPVASKEPLENHVYEYVLPELVEITLPRTAYDRSHPSATSVAYRDHSKQFRASVEKRDMRCVVTGHSSEKASSAYFRASHIVPKRLRDKIRPICERYVNRPEDIISDRFDPRNGLLLLTRLDTPFSLFDLGLFRDPVGSRYALH
jgi:hypothetical protein